MRFPAAVVCLFLSALSIKTSGQAVLQGNARQFAGEQLLVRRISNPVTGNSEIIDTISVENNGSFQKNIGNATPGWIFINTGVYRATLFIVPGYVYEIVLPPKTEKSEADIRNPYFKPVVTHIFVIQEYPLNNPENRIKHDNLNSRIFRFDSLLLTANYKMMESMRIKSPIDPDSIIRTIENNYVGDTVQYFYEYRKLRYGLLRINSRDVGLQYIYENHLKTIVPKPENPAWYELFNEMYKDFLFYFARTEEGKQVSYLINRKQDPVALKEALMLHPAVPDRMLAELILIRDIFNAYFQDYFYREALLILLDKIIIDPEADEHAIYASGVKQHLTRLKTGNTPPEFELTDQKNRVVTLDDFRGKYVYLNFCTPDNYSCLKEYPFLKAIHDIHNEYLAVVTVMITEEHESMVRFMEKNRYDWTSLFYGNDENLLIDYNVRAYPTYYLLDPEGTLLRSPAALATEGFEQQLFGIMRARGDL
jgi:peroxiredoxin